MLEELSHEIQEILERIRPAVVTVGAGKATPRTGLVIDRDEVLTVAMEAERGERVPVHGVSGEIEATVTAFDPASGIALLSAPGAPEPASLADAIPRLGELTITVAAPIPDDYEARLSMVRCVGGQTRLQGGRRVASYLQTDAARFRGFGASVLVNRNGEAAGVTMPTGRREEPFVLPMPEVLLIVQELRNGETVGTGYLGVRTTDAALPVAVAGSDHGLLITRVEEGSPAERSRLAVGTFIIKVGDTMTTDVEHLYDALVGLRAGVKLPVTVATSEGAVSTVEVEVVLRR